MAAAPAPVLPLAAEPAAAAAAWLADLGPEDEAWKARVYLITFSRILPSTLAVGELQDLEALTRADVRDAVCDAWQRPLPDQAGRGRPRTEDGPRVLKLVVFRSRTAMAQSISTWPCNSLHRCVGRLQNVS